MTSSPKASEADHLAVLVHGLWGQPKHLDFVRDTLREQYADDRLHILVATSIADNKTYDGIEVGGERVVNEIEERIAQLESDGHTIRKISITGYSLGGLIARYAIGVLYSSGLFDRIQPVNFSTFATPHLGVRTPKRGARSYIFNVLGAKTLSTSGQQMFLVDDFRDTKRPLLSIMADPNSVFVKGLSRFKNKWIYANTMNDRSVPYYTSAISRTDPFVELDKISVHYLKEQPAPGEVILDPSHAVSTRRSAWEDMSAFERIYTAPRQTLRSLPYYLLFLTLVPIALPAFILNAGYQTYQSAQRIRLHESGKAFKLDKYRVKFLEEAEAATDRAYERITNSSREEYLPTPPPEPASEASSTTDSEQADNEDLKLSKRESRREKSHDFPILALTEEQFDMIENLDKLGFAKFPVHITKVRHTHAAIVVRMQKPLSGTDSFSEGKVVVKHWAERFEV
ncbi:Putative alpha/Beta hydrolase, lipase [Septoria linicola]|uniref:Alpha/Beta hydrolase, lipase n=1 Tax=Septoria linicola TaxID=215465 RepID=A0A9Q9EDJ2_9PEZI|nr:putative alpha/Beta hydrolase, lipase [Septoria linicola]USW46860.1 Putative alpha/Beta hydrolase, lipase [Septoria linicola]